MSNNANNISVKCVNRNEDGVYERMGDDQVYEQLDEPDLLVVGESAADTSSTTYENTTEPILTGIFLLVFYLSYLFCWLDSISLNEKENDENVYELTDIVS